jgi:hypothetical protein
MPVFVVALAFAAHASALANPARKGGGTPDAPTGLVTVSLAAVHEVPSKAFESALRARAFTLDNPVGSALDPDSEVVVVGRGRFSAGASNTASPLFGSGAGAGGAAGAWSR